MHDDEDYEGVHIVATPSGTCCFTLPVVAAELPVHGMAKRIAAFEALLDTIRPRWRDDPSLMDTPTRMAKAWSYWTSGYDEDVEALFKTFTKPAGMSEMIVVKDIDVNSLCEHHGAAIFGTATVAYIPTGRILGLSKVSRIVDAFAKRLQTQERLTNEIADALAGVGVIIKARHMCMESRGICKRGQVTITSALRGAMVDGTVRAEFLALAAS
jgi:GTP cyclohydrolase I